MNEISNEVRAVEIHQKATSYYQASEQFAYKFLMEIKILRDEKLYKELGYEDFESYTLDNFGYSRETITNRIQSAEALGLDYDEALRHFGKTKTRLLGLMPEPEREQALEYGIPTDNGIKSIEEATTREIEKYQKQLKQKDELIESLGGSMHEFEVYAKELESENERLKNQKPQVVEKVIEKEPEDYQSIKESNRNMEEQLSRLTNDLKLAHTKYELLESSTAEAKQLKQQIDSLKGEQNELLEAVEATKDLNKLEREFHQFFDERLAPMKFKGISQYIGATNAPSRIHDLINLAEAWVEEMRRLIPNGNIKIIEGEFTDE